MRSQEWSQSQVQQSQVQQSQVQQSQVQHSSQEIKQDNLKTQLVSAITDLEGDTEMVDFGKENKTIDLMSPPQAKSPTPKAAAFTPTKQVTIVHLRTSSNITYIVSTILQFYMSVMQ